MSFKAQKAAILSSISPVSLVPSATGTGFLVIGSKMPPCFLPLGTYLVILGSISLSISIVGSVMTILLDKCLEGDVIDAFDKAVIAILKYSSKALVLVEVVLITAGLVLIIPSLSTWQYEDPQQIDSYCDLGSMVLAIAFLSGTWFFITFGAILYLIISYANWSAKNQTKIAQ